jgi:hypothetical protein
MNLHYQDFYIEMSHQLDLRIESLNLGLGLIDFSTFLTLIVNEEVLIIDLSIETLFSTIMSPVAGTELIEESDIPIVELVDPHALKAKAEIRETAL